MMTSALPMPTYGQTIKNNQITGMVDVTLNLDYPVKMGQSGQSDLFLKIKGTDLAGGKVQIEKELVDIGDEKGNVAEFNIPNLEVPQGTYQLELIGAGYTAFSKVLAVQNYNVDIEVETFLAGDVNKDFVVDELDISILEEKVGTNATDLQYDLNRDGMGDITDLAYAYANSTKQKDKEAVVSRTTLIPKAVLEMRQLEKEITDGGVTIINGKVEDLFAEGNTVTFESSKEIDDINPLIIPIAFHEPVTLSQMNLELGREHVPTAFTVEVEEEDGTFKPANPITRGEFVAVITRAFDLEAKGKVNPFKDVEAGKWYTQYIIALHEKGITTGRADGTFGVNDPITNEEIAVMIDRALDTEGIKINSVTTKPMTFKDQKQISSYAKEAVEDLY